MSETIKYDLTLELKRHADRKGYHITISKVGRFDFFNKYVPSSSRGEVSIDHIEVFLDDTHIHTIRNTSRPFFDTKVWLVLYLWASHQIETNFLDKVRGVATLVSRHNYEEAAKNRVLSDPEGRRTRRVTRKHLAIAEATEAFLIKVTEVEAEDQATRWTLHHVTEAIEDLRKVVAGNLDPRRAQLVTRSDVTDR